jgi:hypothetical protein
MAEAQQNGQKVVLSQLDLIVAQFAAAREIVVQGEDDLFDSAAILDPYTRVLDQLELTAEYHLKKSLTDFESFKLTCQLNGTPLLDVVEKLDVKKIDASEVNILNIHTNLLGLTIVDVKKTLFNLLDRVAPAEVSRKTLDTFLDAVARQYRINPYHNFTHCLSVSQVFYYMWSSSSKLQRLLNVDEMYVGCIACIAHDIGHRSLALS